MYSPEELGLDTRSYHGDEVSCICPYHTDHNPSASYNLRKGLFVCYTCGASKNATQLASDLNGTLLPIGPQELRKIKWGGDDFEWRLLLKNPLALDNEYLKSRLVTNELVKRFNILQSKDGIIFPIYGFGGEIVGAQLRQYKGTPKYLTYGKPFLFPLECARRALHTDKVLFVVEGVFGALRAIYSGFNAVAMLGATKVDKIKEFARMNTGIRMFSVLDQDLAGWVSSVKLMPEIKAIHINGEADEITVDNWKEIYKMRETASMKKAKEVSAILPANVRGEFWKRIKSYE